MSRSVNDEILLWSLRLLAVIAGAVVVLIVAFLVKESLPALKQLGVGAFFSGGTWHPASREQPTFDLRPALLGTVLTAGGAVLIAGPLGLFAATFSRFYAPRWLGSTFRRVVELMAGIPSVVYGLWGLTVLVPLIAAVQPPGTSLLAGIVILALMILPTMTLLIDAAFENVPVEYLQAAQALGLSRWGTVAGVVWPLTRATMMTAAFLSLARALGETMAVLMVCGNVVQWPSSVFDPVRTLTANVALEMGYALGVHRGALFVSGLVLTGLVFALVVAAGWFERRPGDG